MFIPKHVSQKFSGTKERVTEVLNIRPSKESVPQRAADRIGLASEATLHGCRPLEPA
jgi:hypothetical protein